MKASLDDYGLAAYCCAADAEDLVPTPNDDDVLHCPRCGHRTDEPGNGTLGDGFDVVSRQWGLRGDPHVWRQLRDRVAETPTPPSAATIRAVLVTAIREICDVDIDNCDEEIVYRDYLDHGGMSGGSISVEWWRSQGLPLIVERALNRRPLG